MKAPIGLFGAALLVVLALPASAATDFDRLDCDSTDVKRRLAGCTPILEDRKEPSKNRAIASELQSLVARLNSRNWPYPVIELFLGRLSADKLMVAAATPSNRCSAQFYIGQWHQLHGNKKEAVGVLEISAGEACRDSYENVAAIAELKRLR